MLAGAIQQSKAIGGVEREYGDIDFLHHFAQQGRCLQRAEPLLAQRLAEGVDFAHHFAECIGVPGAAGANGEVAFVESSEHVRTACAAET